MIAVDTSVWVSALRDDTSAAAGTLRALLDADNVVLPLPVRMELLAGVAHTERSRLQRALSALPVIVPTERTWRVVEAWTLSAADVGQRFGLADMVIGALADEAGALVWSFDRDFDRLARLKLVGLYG
jgi:predicted nucleic acid-binding protein